jgi:hypothetical protein
MHAPVLSGASSSSDLAKIRCLPAHEQSLIKLRSFVIEKPAGLSNVFAIVRKNSMRQLAVG